MRRKRRKKKGKERKIEKIIGKVNNGKRTKNQKIYRKE